MGRWGERGKTEERVGDMGAAKREKDRKKEKRKCYGGTNRQSENVMHPYTSVIS